MPGFRGGIPAFPRRYAWVSGSALGFQFYTDRRVLAVTESPPASRYSLDVVVIGGCGHVGLPLAIALADRGATVAIYDVSTAAVDMVNAAQLPFAEPDAAPVLKLCAVSASPECLMNRGELHLPRKGSPAHQPRPSGSDSTFPANPLCRNA